jgi:hypothetical protein
MLTENGTGASSKLNVARNSGVWLKLNVHGNFFIRCNAIRELNSSASLSAAYGPDKIILRWRRPLQLDMPILYLR